MCWISFCSIHWCIFPTAAAFTDVYFQLLQHSLMFPAVAAFTDVSSCCSIHWCFQLLQHSLMFPAAAAFIDVAICCSIHWCCSCCTRLLADCTECNTAELTSGSSRIFDWRRFKNCATRSRNTTLQYLCTRQGHRWEGSVDRTAHAY